MAYDKQTMPIKREIIEETYCGQVISSRLEDVSTDEIIKATEIFLDTANCDHSIVSDSPGYMYDIRTCAICGEGLGTI